MREAQVDAIIQRVWAAAAGEAAWADVLKAIAGHFDSMLVTLHRFELTQQRLLAQVSGGPANQSDGVLQYVRRYHLQDPRRAQLVQGAVVPHGAWYHDHEHLSPEFVAGDVFHQQFLAAYGGRHVAARTLSPAPDQACLFALELTPERGPLNTDERAELQRLGVHLDDALRSHERQRRLQAQVLAGHQLLHAFAQPMWLMDTDRFLHDANAAAKAEMLGERLLAQRGAYLVARASRLESALRTAIHQLRS